MKNTDAPSGLNATRPEPVHLSKGCFYRDANGEKVGPVYRYSGDTWHAQGSNGVWSGNGKLTGIYGGTDLVAPWVDPFPVAAPTGADGDAIKLPQEALDAWVNYEPIDAHYEHHRLRHAFMAGFLVRSASVPAPTVDGSESDGALVDRVISALECAGWRHEDPVRSVTSVREIVALSRSSLPDAGAGTQGADARAAELEAALREARRDIISITESGVDRLREHGCDVDPAPRTYEIAVAQIDAALSSRQTEARDDEA